MPRRMRGPAGEIHPRSARAVSFHETQAHPRPRRARGGTHGGGRHAVYAQHGVRDRRGRHRRAVRLPQKHRRGQGLLAAYPRRRRPHGDPRLLPRPERTRHPRWRYAHRHVRPTRLRLRRYLRHQLHADNQEVGRPPRFYANHCQPLARARERVLRAARLVQRTRRRESEGRPLHAAFPRPALAQPVGEDGVVHAPRLPAQRIRNQLAAPLPAMLHVLARHQVRRQVPLHRPPRRADPRLPPHGAPHDPRRQPHAGRRPPPDGASGRDSDVRPHGRGAPRRRLARRREALPRLGRRRVLQGAAKGGVGQEPHGLATHRPEVAVRREPLRVQGPPRDVRGRTQVRH